ncbi:MAG: TolB protein [Rhodothalassiaceae bacterium]|nr:MAG: TolB protein [Rhodothalassiaceae bacterium]
MKRLWRCWAAAVLAPVMGLACAAGVAADEEKGWDVNDPPGPKAEAAIDVTSGTWMSLDVSPDGRTIVFDLLGDIYAIPVTGGEAKPLTRGLAWDFQPRFSPDGRRIAFISDAGGGENVWVMDADGGNARQVTKEDFRLLGNPAWSPDGRFIVARKHFTTRRSLGTGELWLYDVEAGGAGVQLVKRPNERYQKELGEPAFSPDGRFLYYTQAATPGDRFQYAEDSNKDIFHIKRLELATGRIEDFVAGPGGAVRPTPSPDGRFLAFVRRIRAVSALWIKDLESGAERAVYKPLDDDMQETWGVQGLYPNFAWTPDSQAIVFWAGGKIRRLDIRTGAVSEIPFHVKDTRSVLEAVRFQHEVAPDVFRTKMVRFPAVSPDGRRVVFESLGKLWVKELPDGRPRRLTRDESGARELFPAFSRDGRRVVFVRWSDSELGSVRVVDADGGRAEVISPEPGHYWHPAFSPDGRIVVVERRTGGWLTSPLWSLDPGIYAIDVKTRRMRRITREGRNPQFGASGDRLFYVRDGERHELVSCDLNGEAVRVHARSEYGRDFAVSPDGRHLAWRQSYQVYLMPMAPGGVLELNPEAKALPMRRVSPEGSSYMAWRDAGHLVFNLGPMLHQVTTAAIHDTGFKAPETLADLSMEVRADKPSGVVALLHARIITMDEARRVIDDGVVVIEGNRIRAVGRAGEVAIPEGAKTVDLAGRTVLPGLIDIHAHGPQGVGDLIPEQNWSALAHLALGVTTIHDPSNRSSEIFAAAEYQRAGRLMGPRMFSTGEVIYGARSEGFVDIRRYEDALAAVRRLKAQGAISVKNYNQPRREQRQMVVEAARSEGVNVVAEGGSLYHMDMTLVVDGNTGVEHNVPVERFYDDVLQLWPQTKVGNTPTLIVSYGGLSAETYFYQHDDVWKHPILSRFVPPHVLQPRSVRRLKAPEEDYHHLFAAAAGAAELMRRGVPVNAGAHGQREGLGMHWEIRAMAKGGMTPMEALATATINPARYMGFDRDLGSIEPGKLADLIVVDGDPLADLTVSDRLVFVVQNGRIYREPTLEEVVTGDRRLAAFYWQPDR